MNTHPVYQHLPISPSHPVVRRGAQPGFALIATISVMVLLVMIALAMLSLSTITTRHGSSKSAEIQAQANARLALMLAIGELQKQMGPDMRVSAESAILDTDESTPEIDGVAQSRWLASYDSWGSWLNASYTRPDVAGSMDIQDTYTKGRDKMFRRWLLSLPEGSESNFDMPRTLTGLDPNRLAIMVGEGSLGAKASTHPDQVTKAYLLDVGERGRHAWWIGPENHRAKVTLSNKSRNLAASDWETSQGDTAEVGVGALDGFEFLDTASTTSDRLITRNTLDPAGADSEDVRGHFFYLTAHSQGVIASVRAGHLKKDLSLLFEKGNSALPAPYKFSPGDIREPSIRPMSVDLQSENPIIPSRHFASWTNMRHYYRMYRSTDATIGETGGSGSLNWNGSKPWTDVVSTTGLGKWGSVWDGSNNYWRVPILAKITFIYSLVSEPHPSQPGKYNCYHVYSPVFTFWNPYNTELRLPDNKIEYLTSAYKSWPNSGEFWLGGVLSKTSDQLGAFGQFGYSQGVNTRSKLRSGGSSEIVFKPGEFRVFSHGSAITNGGQAASADLLPGFDPQAIGGEKKLYGTYTPGQRPGIKITFSHNYWGGNINYGNTCGSLCMVSWWDRSRNGGAIPLNYAHDWLNKSQRLTPITLPNDNDVARWVFSDNAPVPVGFCQLVIKGLSEFNYESITWDEDWRSRNWIQSPPSYFGSGLYISEDPTIAHTQRIDDPYVVFFGPTSMAEMPKVVGQIGQNSFLGSGSSPYEKITAASVLELPTAPLAGLASFSGMRINPGWVAADKLSTKLSVNTYSGNAVQSFGKGESLYAAETKRVAYQSGVTGTGIGNSFMHPMLPRDGIYHYFNNSVSQDILNRNQPDSTTVNDTEAYSDYWDHVFLLNDALWDDYFVSSLADQTRPGASGALSLNENLDSLVEDEELSNSRYQHYQTGESTSEIKSELQAQDGYLKAARHLMVDGSFNVNSTSVDAWHALFAGIRERKVIYRDGNGSLKEIQVPSGKQIALSRLNTAITNQEMDDPAEGVTLPDGRRAWSGVRFLDDDQLRKLAEECVKQVKLRGPFLNYSEFINRRLSNDRLGLMGALQSAIDYDDSDPESGSINYLFKSDPVFMITKDDLNGDSVSHAFSTPEASEGSRLAGIPGYVIQSDILKPLGNTLTVRDDTFRIRAYGESLDGNGNVIARAWCEAIVQRFPEYSDPTNDDHVAARTLDAQGNFVDNSALTDMNRRYGRRFQIKSFRWLSKDEI